MQNIINGCYKGRSAFMDESLLRASYFTSAVKGIDSNLGFLRNYVASAGAKNKNYMFDMRYVFANPRFCRFLSSEAPKKKSMCMIDFRGEVIGFTVVLSILYSLVFYFWIT